MIGAERADETSSQKPIERDDWPGPPEPAAAYPELCEYTVELLDKFCFVLYFHCCLVNV